MTKKRIYTTVTNETEGYVLGDESIALAETWMGEDASMGELYRASQAEYGRCTSRVYVDTTSGPKTIGWFFVKRDAYVDTGETYLRGAWVTVQ